MSIVLMPRLKTANTATDTLHNFDAKSVHTFVVCPLCADQSNDSGLYSSFMDS